MRPALHSERRGNDCPAGVTGSVAVALLVIVIVPWVRLVLKVPAADFLVIAPPKTHR